MRAAFTLLLCIVFFGNGFALPHPGWFSGMFGGSKDPVTKPPEIQNNVASTATDTQGFPEANYLPPNSGLTGVPEPNFMEQNIGDAHFPQYTNGNRFTFGSRPPIVPPHLQNEIGGLMGNLKEKAGNVAAQIGTLVKTEGKAIVSEIKKKVGAIANEIGSLSSGEGVKQIKENVRVAKGKLENLVGDIKSIMQSQSGKPISEQLIGTSDFLGPVLGEIGETIAGKQGEHVMSDIGKHMGKIMNEVGNTIGGESVNKLVTKLGEIKDTVSDAVREVGSVRYENRPVSEQIEEVGEKLRSALSKVGSAVGGENGEKIMGDIGGRLSNIFDKVGSAVDSDSVKKISSVATGISGQMSDAVGQLKSFAKNTNTKDIMQVASSRGPIAIKLLLEKYGGLIKRIPALKALYEKLSSYIKVPI